MPSRQLVARVTRFTSMAVCLLVCLFIRVRVALGACVSEGSAVRSCSSDVCSSKCAGRRVHRARHVLRRLPRHVRGPGRARSHRAHHLRRRPRVAPGRPRTLRQGLRARVRRGPALAPASHTARANALRRRRARRVGLAGRDAGRGRGGALLLPRAGHGAARWRARGSAQQSGVRAVRDARVHFPYTAPIRHMRIPMRACADMHFP